MYSEPETASGLGVLCAGRTGPLTTHTGVISLHLSDATVHQR